MSTEALSLDIEMANMELMSGANRYANGLRTPQGKESISLWLDDIRSLNYLKPFFRTIEGRDNTLFVMDIDTSIRNLKQIEKYYTQGELREIKIRAVCNYFEGWLKEHPDYNFTKYISGQGLYLVQKYNKSVPKHSLSTVLWNDQDDSGILKKCSSYEARSPHKNDHLRCDGWHHRGSDIHKVIEHDGVHVLLKIDMSMISGKGDRLARMPYSAYYKLDEGIYYCSIIVERDDGSWDIDRTLDNSLYHYMSKIKGYNYDVHEFQFEHLVKNLGDIKRSVRYREPSSSSSDNFHYKINVPEPDEELDTRTIVKLNMMEEMVSSPDVTVTPPCMKRFYDDDRVDSHWRRVALLRYLAVKGEYSPSDVGTFIRFRVNDEDDNLPENKDKLHLYTPLFYGHPDKPNYPPGCSVIQDRESVFYACGAEEKAVCKRYKPLDPQKSVKKKDNVPMLVTREDEEEEIEENVEYNDRNQVNVFRDMSTKMRRIIDDTDTNYEIIKTTRAGVTTTLINESVRTGKKLLVLSPTNAIGERTFKDAMWLLKRLYDIEVKGALLSANSKSCLKLQLKSRGISMKKSENPDWGESGVAYQDLSFHFKPTCISEKDICQYFDDTFDLPYMEEDGIPLPVVESKIENMDIHIDDNNAIRTGNSTGRCAYQSVIQQMNELDVLFITYDKLRALSLDEDRVIINDLLSVFDIVFMDEISQFAQKNDDAFQIYMRQMDNRSWDIFSEIEEEISKIGTTRSETMQFLIEIMRQFNDFYFDLILDWEAENRFTDNPFIERFENFLDIEDRQYVEDNFGALYSTIEWYATRYNIHLKYSEIILKLISSDFWWVQNIPSVDKVVDVSIISSPIINHVRNFVRYFDRNNDKQVIVTDATMPLIKMSELLNIEFERFVLGDPRKTNDYQLIVSDNRRIFPFRFFGENSSRYVDDLVDFIQSISEIHDPKNIMLVLPNSRGIYFMMRRFVREGRLSDDLDITYFRSVKTVGVASDRRIMITVCAPYPPTGSYYWLASYYHELGLYNSMTMIELSSILEEMNAHQTFYQTIGRAKAPDNSERSIVYTWGMDKITLNNIIQMDDDVPIPNIVDMTFNNSRTEIYPKLADLWRQHHVIVKPVVIRILSYLNKNAGNAYTLSLLKRNLRLSDSEINYLTFVNPLVYDYFSIFYYEKNNVLYLYCE